MNLKLNLKFLKSVGHSFLVAGLLGPIATFAQEKEYSTVDPNTQVLGAESTDEDWKGNPSANHFDAGLLLGIGVFDGNVGFAAIPTIARKLTDDGFVPDINDRANLELMAGPVFIQGEVLLQYSLHLRWDFIKDDTWMLYGLGGFGGEIAGSGLGDPWRFHVRTAVGAMARINPTLQIRTEFSHELIVAGISAGF